MNQEREKTIFPEPPFIVCRRRKNQPQVSPLICEKRCPRKKNCPEYFDYLQPALFPRYDRREARGKNREDSLLRGKEAAGLSDSAVGEIPGKRRP